MQTLFPLCYDAFMKTLKHNLYAKLDLIFGLQEPRVFLAAKHGDFFFH